ncbi:hypothetical protein GCM10022420_047670 [Streptomyces iranensis]
MQAGGGAAEVQFLGYSDEVPKLPQVHDRPRYRDARGDTESVLDLVVSDAVTSVRYRTEEEACTASCYRSTARG